MHNEKAGRPTLSSDGSRSRVVNFRLSNEQLEQLQAIHQARDPKKYGYWRREDISFSEMVRQILLHEPIFIRVAALESDVNRYYTELREVENLLRRRRVETELEEFLAALKPAMERISELQEQVKRLSLQPIASLKE